MLVSQVVEPLPILLHKVDRVSLLRVNSLIRRTATVWLNLISSVFILMKSLALSYLLLVVPLLVVLSYLLLKLLLLLLPLLPLLKLLLLLLLQIPVALLVIVFLQRCLTCLPKTASQFTCRRLLGAGDL